MWISTVCRAIVLMVTISGISSGAQSEEMRFEQRCIGNATEGCFLIAEGTITSATPEAFQQSISGGVEGRKVLLNSPGGNLAAGVRLGRMIRESGFRTLVGEGTNVRNGDGWPGPADCLSACAYAFLGGERRQFDGGSRIGFHQFALAGRGLIAYEDTQVISGELVSYIVEMGVDARIFAIASREVGNSFYYVSENEAVEFGLMTSSGYGAFFLEPFQGGIIAASRRRDEPMAYDQTYQITALCRTGKPYLLFTTLYGASHPAEFSISIDENYYSIPKADVSVRQKGDIGFLEVRLNQQVASNMIKGSTIETSFDYSRSDGWHFGTRLNLSQMDRNMIESAFKHCI